MTTLYDLYASARMLLIIHHLTAMAMRQDQTEQELVLSFLCRYTLAEAAKIYGSEKAFQAELAIAETEAIKVYVPSD